jgi:peptidoglycan/xylan/chitin deacetylase (PgdA/CDA1 family)
MMPMKRRNFLAGLGLVSAGAVAGAVTGFTAEPAMATESPTARTVRPSGQTAAFTSTVTFRTSPAAKLLALTIDDGPTAEWTPKMLAVLARHDVRATFFLVGKRLAVDPAPTRQAAAAGHEFGNHTWQHADLTRHDSAFVKSSLLRNHELITAITGVEPTLCRPPYGRIDSVGLGACAALGYDVALWSDHITGSNPGGDVTTTLKQASAGSIVLSHDGGPEPNDNLVSQLDRLIGGLKAEGYTFATVSELMSAPSANK